MDHANMNTETGNSYLVITASGVDRIGIVDQLAGRIADCGCNIEESRMTMLEGHFRCSCWFPAHGMRSPGWKGRWARWANSSA